MSQQKARSNNMRQMYCSMKQLECLVWKKPARTAKTARSDNTVVSIWGSIKVAHGHVKFCMDDTTCCTFGDIDSLDNRSRQKLASRIKDTS